MKRIPAGTWIAFFLFGAVSAGAWGAGAFDNDDAADWLDSLIKQNGVELIYRTLEQAKGASYIEAPLGSMAVAAAEVATALNGKPGRDITPGALERRRRSRVGRSNVRLASPPERREVARGCPR